MALWRGGINLFSALFVSIFKVLIPVGITAYLLIGWMLHAGKIEPFGNKKELEEKLKALKKGRKERKEKETNFALKKWMTFGGGFYGTAAFYTYFVIELAEILSFLGKIMHPENWSFHIGIDLIVNFFINSIMNFVSAILWFQYWEVGGNAYIWVNFLTAYAGYFLGSKLANIHLAEDVGHPQLWRWWGDQKTKHAESKAKAQAEAKTKAGAGGGREG